MHHKTDEFCQRAPESRDNRSIDTVKELLERKRVGEKKFWRDEGLGKFVMGE